MSSSPQHQDRTNVGHHARSLGERVGLNRKAATVVIDRGMAFDEKHRRHQESQPALRSSPAGSPNATAGSPTSTTPGVPRCCAPAFPRSNAAAEKPRSGQDSSVNDEAPTYVLLSKRATHRQRCAILSNRKAFLLARIGKVSRASAIKSSSSPPRSTIGGHRTIGRSASPLRRYYHSSRPARPQPSWRSFDADKTSMPNSSISVISSRPIAKISQPDELGASTACSPSRKCFPPRLIAARHATDFLTTSTLARTPHPSLCARLAICYRHRKTLLDLAATPPGRAPRHPQTIRLHRRPPPNDARACAPKSRNSRTKTSRNSTETARLPQFIAPPHMDVVPTSDYNARSIDSEQLFFKKLRRRASFSVHVHRKLHACAWWLTSRGSSPMDDCPKCQTLCSTPVRAGDLSWEFD